MTGTWYTSVELIVPENRKKIFKKLLKETTIFYRISQQISKSGGVQGLKTLSLSLGLWNPNF